MRTHKCILLITAFFLLASLFACKEGDSGQSQSEPPPLESLESGMLTITFNYENQSGSASNQFAVWIEDMAGSYIQTLYVTRWTANGGYKSRPDSIALWVEKSGLDSLDSTKKAQIDAVAGATPRAGNLSYYWDLKDTNGETVPPGEYKFFVEGTLRWKNYVLYSGTITIGGEAVTVTADAEFIYEASDRYDALTGDSPENAMIGTVTAIFTPIDDK